MLAIYCSQFQKACCNMERKRKCFLALALFLIIGISCAVGISLQQNNNAPQKPQSWKPKPAVNNRPIIGVLAQEYDGPYKPQDGKEWSYIAASYIKFVELGGAQAIPIMVDQPKDYYEDVFSKINGVLFPGGDANITVGKYATAARYIYQLAIEANDAGDPFPLFGTCLGMELLTALTAGRDTLVPCDSNDQALPLTFTEEAEKSEMLGTLPNDVEYYLKNLNVTINYHNWCATIESFRNSSLDQFYRVTSTNYDSNGLEFISSIEAKSYPIFGVQFHPEKNNFEWVDRNPLHNNIPHSYEAVRVDQHFANFFVQQARQSRHKFDDVSDENDYLIHNYHPVFSAENSTFTSIYIFPY